MYDFQKLEYLIKWEGYSKEESTWEPEDNLVNCDQVLSEYRRKTGLSSMANRAHYVKAHVKAKYTAAFQQAGVDLLSAVENNIGDVRFLFYFILS